MFNLKSTAAAIGAAAVLLGVSSHARANVSDTTYLTFNQAVSLPGVRLPAGTYIFERADENTPDIVRVMSRDRRTVYLTAFTTSIRRPQNLSGAVVLLGEVARGATPEVRAWFPTGDVVGHQFNYDR